MLFYRVGPFTLIHPILYDCILLIVLLFIILVEILENLQPGIDKSIIKREVKRLDEYVKELDEMTLRLVELCENQDTFDRLQVSLRIQLWYPGLIDNDDDDDDDDDDVTTDGSVVTCTSTDNVDYSVADL